MVRVRVRTIVLTSLVACGHPAATMSSRTTAPPPTPACVEPPGEPIRWAALYCQYKNETDDLESTAVTDCMNSLRTFGSRCDEKRFYKGEICKLVKPGDAACIDDPQFVPPEVTEGFGG